MNTKLLALCFSLAIVLRCPAAAYVGIHAAAAEGDLVKLQEYLIADAQAVSTRDRSGRTPLCIAALCGQTEAVQFLLSRGADVNDRGYQELTPLADMAMHGSTNDQRCAEIATLLLARGAEVDPLDTYPATPLLHAVQMGKPRLVRVLLEHGASQTNIFTGPHARSTPLLFALRNEHMEMARLLLEFNPPLEIADANGATPLLWAIQSRKLDVVRLLLEHGARITPPRTVPAAERNSSLYYSIRDDNLLKAPLLMAISRNDKDLLELLLKFNPPIDAVDQDGMTALHCAARLGNLEPVRLLLNAGASLTNVDYNGATPLLLAETAEHKEIVELLRQAALSQGVSLAETGAPSREAMRAMAQRICDGDAGGFDELAAAAEQLRIGRVKEQAQVRLNADRMDAAFQVLGEEAGKGNDNAFQALKKCLGHNPLKYFTAGPLGVAAAAGHREAVEILVAYKEWGLLETDADFALVAPARANVQPAVDYFAQLLLDPSHSKPAWSGVRQSAKEALESAAAQGNQNAKAALEKYAAASAPAN
jgi:ankyrin repeat protein